MIYLNEKNLKEIGLNWSSTVEVIEEAVKCLENSDYAQPIKPYLRYQDLKNRIIAMPAFIGGGIDFAGIKWIASFPDNIHKGIPRAHSVVILNNAETGQPVSIINTALLSIVRTASVSGLMIKYFDKCRNLKKFNLGIIGWGPIGQHHFKMCTQLYGDKIDKIFIYDIRPVIDVKDIDFYDKSRIIVCDNWENVYMNSDILITCTVSNEPYIDKRPKDGALLLNVSLRDYKTDIIDYVAKPIIVDDWDEVCREKTDIEMMHLNRGLIKQNTKSIANVVCNNCIDDIPKEQAIMFNPMGMGVFDIAIASYYYTRALELNMGNYLE